MQQRYGIVRSAKKNKQSVSEKGKLWVSNPLRDFSFQFIPNLSVQYESEGDHAELWLLGQAAWQS
jgi:hypothetical protein